MPEKIRISTRISRDVWEDFKYYVFKKHGKLHGVLGEELEKAIDFYISHVTSENIPDIGYRLTEILREIERFNERISEIVEDGFVRADLLVNEVNDIDYM